MDIRSLKIFVKAHVYMLIYYFFINAFPVYDEKSRDKPNLYNTDPEEAAGMDFNLKISDSLICFVNHLEG